MRAAIPYRREIDGLRAIAVLSVVFYHAGFQALRGGFLGVDIFFVISGYLITSILLQERSDGTYTLAGFYERRVRRILPALFFVTLCCLPAAWFLLLPREMLDFSRSVTYVQLFVSNVYFRKHTDYFGVGADQEPMLHTWSLGIEEQYYVLFPLLLALLWRLRRRWLVGAVAAILVASLLYSQWRAGSDSTANFYLLPSRAWELMVGSVIAAWAFWRGQPSLGPRGDAWLALAGLALVLVCVAALDEHFPSPSLYTLLPTLGAALIILFAKPDNLAGRILGSPWAVGIGLISYSVYLWHQPLLAFLRAASVGEPSKAALVAAALLSLGAGYASWRWIEKPFRNRAAFSRRAVFQMAGVGMLALIAVGALGEAKLGFKERYALPAAIESQVTNLAHPACPEYHDGACLLGDPSQQPTAILLGDSHLEALTGGFDIAGKALKTSFVLSTSTSCVPLQGVYVLKHEFTRRCRDLAASQMKLLQDQRGHIHKVFLAARWAFYTDGYYSGLGINYLGLAPSDPWTRAVSRHAFDTGVAETIEAIRDLGYSVYVVLQVPQPIAWVPDIYYRAYADAAQAPETFARMQAKWATPLADHLALQAYNRTLFDFYARAGAVTLVNLDDVFCKAECALGTLEHPYYIDNSHLSGYGSAMTAAKLAQYLR